MHLGKINKKILMISTDRKAFEKESDVRRRFTQYGSLVDELHIIVFAKKNLGFKKEHIAQNTFLYPTNSSSALRYIPDALKIGKGIEDIDLITTQDPFETGIVGVTLAQKLHARLEVQLHTDFLSPYFKAGTIKNIIRIPIGKRVLKKADTIRVVSKRIQNSITSNIHIPKSKITVLPIFVDTEKIRQTPISVDVHKKYPQFDFIILMVSRLTKEKNIARAIDALRNVIKTYPKTGLVLVGEGSERERLEKHVRNLELTDAVIFEGWQNNMSSYYKTVDLFLSTSLYEGYGVTFVESLAAGTPVLSTDVGVAREVGGDIFTTDEELEQKIKAYVDGKEGNRGLTSYPYSSEIAYLKALKKSWE